MANPTPTEVNAKTASKAEATTTNTTTTAAPFVDAEAASPKSERFRVLKAFTLDDGLTVMPGEEFDPAGVATWPARRTKQLVDQKYLRPIA